MLNCYRFQLSLTFSYHNNIKFTIKKKSKKRLYLVRTRVMFPLFGWKQLYEKYNITFAKLDLAFVLVLF